MATSGLNRKTDRSVSAVKDNILDIAEKLAQTRGFNGFSYADIAKELNVTKASLHYHYPSKADLGCALIIRYNEVFTRTLHLIDSKESSAQKKLQRYIKLYEEVMRNDRMCLCGMFAAEYATLPRRMQEELRTFFDNNERWLTKVLVSGRRGHELEFKEKPRECAQAFLGALEGAMLVARSYGDSNRFRSAANHVMAKLLIV